MDRAPRARPPADRGEARRARGGAAEAGRPMGCARRQGGTGSRASHGARVLARSVPRAELHHEPVGWYRTGTPFVGPFTTMDTKDTNVLIVYKERKPSLVSMVSFAVTK